MELIVPKLYEFFDYSAKGILGRSLFEFVKDRSEYFYDDKDGNRNINMGMVSYLSSICKKMMKDNLLIRLKTNGVDCLNDVFFVELRPDNFQNPELFKSQLAYGYYDFAYNSFPFIREHFYESVVPFVGINKNGDNDIGTAYYIGEKMFVTAGHCILDMPQFSLQYQNGKHIKISEIHLDSNSDIDIAIIKADEDISLEPFMLGEPNVLDDVLVMGYPPITGMDTVLISETGSINTFLPFTQKASDGQVVAEAKSYLSNTDCFMINCRVKGGNSGSPVINEHGLVVGTVTSLPFDNQGGSKQGRYDIMGFGICLSSRYLSNIMRNPKTIPVIPSSKFYSLSN